MYQLEEIQQMPASDYGMVREKLRSGDLFFASGNYPLSKIIKQMSDSTWSHVGLILRAEEIGRVLLLESVENAGVRFAPLSKYLEDYDDGQPYNGSVYIARYEGPLPEPQLLKMARFGCDLLARPYDMQQLVQIMGRIVLGSQVDDKKDAYICSELVDECFQEAGIAFKQKNDQFISPDDIASDPNVKFLWKLKD